MASAAGVSSAQLEESLWIEIIRRMEQLYADLAQAQTVAERKNEELLRAKAFADNILRSMVNSLLTTDRDSVITTVNDACCRLLVYGREELVGKPIETIFADGAPNPLRRGSGLWIRLRATGSVTDLETTLRTSSGEEVPVSLNASVLRERTGDMMGTVLVATDLREMKRLLAEARAAAAAEREQAAKRAEAYRELKALQARLIQSEKISSLGRMAASVAHEINNPLGAVVVYSHLLLESTAEDFPGRPNLQKIVREATRCQNIVRGLLDFARPGRGARLPADLNGIVHAALDLLRGQAPFRNIAVAFDLSPTPLEVTCDPSQVQQAFTNLLVNAAEAMSGGGSPLPAMGALSIRSWLDPARQAAAVSFTDTGCGIPPENLERIFEPFFTTKQGGHGTGLGLAIVYGIIDRHGGTLKVDSQLGKGTTFTVWLPLKGAEEAAG
ncbi:MAG: PAS domain S-box protein [Planctomycetes bacterium]|nr:PAS domain S-box protein [Planctomycetota bacterium]